MKILVINQNTCNFGDDAAGVALMQQIESMLPDAEVSIIYSNHSAKLSPTTIPFDTPKTTHLNEIFFDESKRKDFGKYLLNHFFGLSLQLSQRMRAYIETVIKSDVIIISPCGANIGIYQDWQFLLRILIATFEKKKIFFHLNTIHKSKNSVFNSIARFVLSRAQIYVRENSSYNALIKWGLNPIQGVDTAFSLATPDDATSNYFEKFEKYIAFIPTDLSWHPNFRDSDNKLPLKESILATTKFANSNNLCVTIIPHLYGPMIEKAFLTNVLEIFLESGMAKEKINLDWDIDTVWKYQEAIKKSKIAISMRYHGIVFAAKCCVPFISVSYENKMNEVCSYTGMMEYCVSAKTVTENELFEIANTAYINSKKITEELRSRHDFLYRASRIVIDNIKLKKSYGAP